MILRRYSFILLLALIFAACAPGDPGDDAIERAIERHGVDQLDQAEVHFTFRDDDYRMLRDEGQFRYERTYGDTTDIITNDGPSREVSGDDVALSEQESYNLETIVNSVIYFAFLPYRLTDAAVRAQHLGSSEVDGEMYSMVKVTFDEEGGGRDHDDRFVYWFHEEDNTLDYFSYYFFTDGGGSRFRSAQNRREVEGVLIQDYQNYVANPDTVEIDELERYVDLYETNNLELVSEVALENVTIRPLE